MTSSASKLSDATSIFDALMRELQLLMRFSSITSVCLLTLAEHARHGSDELNIKELESATHSTAHVFLPDITTLASLGLLRQSPEGPDPYRFSHEFLADQIRASGTVPANSKNKVNSAIFAEQIAHGRTAREFVRRKIDQFIDVIDFDYYAALITTFTLLSVVKLIWVDWPAWEYGVASALFPQQRWTVGLAIYAPISVVHVGWNFYVQRMSKLLLEKLSPSAANVAMSRFHILFGVIVATYCMFDPPESGFFYLVRSGPSMVLTLLHVARYSRLRRKLGMRSKK